MPRNGSGTFSITNDFSPNTTILSSKVNENFTDVGNELTNSLAKDGQTVMTGQLKADDGVVGAPGITFGADLDTGLYRPSANALQVALGGVAGAKFLGAGITMGRRTITGADTVAATDNGGIIEVTSGTFTLAFTAAATLGSGFWCIIYNSGTGDVTLDPNSSEQIDGLTTWLLYPGGAILVRCSGSAFESILLAPMRKRFDASGTFTKPGVGTFCQVEAWGGGGSGGRAGSADGGGGGGGGAYIFKQMLLSVLGTTETVTIGAGGIAASADNTSGQAGGNTTLGSLVTAYGGGGGDGTASQSGGGGGGGVQGAGTTASSLNGGDGGQPQVPFLVPAATSVAALAGAGAASVGVNGSGAVFGGGGGGAGNTAGVGGSGGQSYWGGGGGGGGAESAVGGPGGFAVFGGGGGGGGSGTTTGGAGGLSLNGGAGGAGSTAAAAATAGTQPGGGGGGSEQGNSGAGGDGSMIILVW